MPHDHQSIAREGRLTLDLTGRQASALRRATLNGDYNLLLGAGASRDSLGPEGKPLPTSQQLIQELVQTFDIPVESGDLLWRVYDRAVNSVGESEVYRWMRKRFWHVRPPDWMDIYARMPWSAVWTLNVDDTYESAYARVRTELSRSLVTLNWDDDFRYSRDLAVVHLHGCVDTPQPRKLVFSLSEYASAAVSRAAWPANFRDVYGISPFVILGARLRDEPDIEAVISNRRPTHDAPSFYVSPEISPAMHADLTNWNLIPVRMTAEEFSLEWTILTGLELDREPEALEEITYRLGRQFVELRTNQPPQAPHSHDFLGGDAPLWPDIVRDYYAELQWIQQASADCNQLGLTSPPSSVVVYVGHRLVGRSTGLLALARLLRSQSWRTFLFSADTRPDVDALLRFGADGRAIALFFDGVADIAEDIALLTRRARSSNLKIASIAVDHSNNTENILGRIEGRLLVHQRVGVINHKLTRLDASRLVDKLESVGRLGFLESDRRDSRRIAHFRNRGIFDAMAQLENAPGFGRRIGELVGQIQDPRDIELLLLSSMAARVERTLLTVDAARMLGVESDQLVRQIRSASIPLKAVVTSDGVRITTRHRWLALNHCITRLGTSRSMEFLGDALRRVAPFLNRRSQRERNATTMLAGSLMSRRNMIATFPEVELDNWYESLDSAFGSWSARYWEQRAITARHAGYGDPATLAKAESFALRAVGIVRDAYSLTTLGTVLLDKAAFSPSVDVAAYYNRAIGAYEDANIDMGTNLVGWFAYLRHALNVLRRLQAAENEEKGLLEEIGRDWIRISSDVGVIANQNDQTQRTLDGLKRQFERLMASEPTM